MIRAGGRACPAGARPRAYDFSRGQRCHLSAADVWPNVSSSSTSSSSPTPASDPVSRSREPPAGRCLARLHAGGLEDADGLGHERLDLRLVERRVAELRRLRELQDRRGERVVLRRGGQLPRRPSLRRSASARSTAAASSFFWSSALSPATLADSVLAVASSPRRFSICTAVSPGRTSLRQLDARGVLRPLQQGVDAPGQRSAALTFGASAATWSPQRLDRRLDGGLVEREHLVLVLQFGERLHRLLLLGRHGRPRRGVNVLLLLLRRPARVLRGGRRTLLGR